MEQVITCINCPMGCRMTVTQDDQTGAVLSVTGNTCPRGDRYARQECTAPERVITAVIPVSGSPVPLSVKTAAPVPKRLIPDVMRALGELRLSAPIAAGTPVLPDVLSTGVDVIATRSVYTH